MSCADQPFRARRRLGDVGNIFATAAGPPVVAATALPRAGDLRGQADAALAFDAFARAQLGGLSRLAWLLTGDRTTAEDLTAETLLAAWDRWERLLEVENPVAYLRRIMVNQAAVRIRSAVRERRRLRLFHVDALRAGTDPDGGVVVDVRAALRHLPVRRRACVVLRHAFDLSEEEVARILGISVGTVKSQTSRGMAQLQRLLSGGDGDA